MDVFPLFEAHILKQNSNLGKSNLTYDEAMESERKARKRLGDIPKPLRRGLLWIADHTSRGRISDLVDDVYIFANSRFFIGEIVEGIIGDVWCDCKVMKVFPPTQEEIDKVNCSFIFLEKMSPVCLLFFT